MIPTDFLSCWASFFLEYLVSYVGNIGKGIRLQTTVGGSQRKAKLDEIAAFLWQMNLLIRAWTHGIGVYLSLVLTKWNYRAWKQKTLSCDSPSQSFTRSWRSLAMATTCRVGKWGSWRGQSDSWRRNALNRLSDHFLLVLSLWRVFIACTVQCLRSSNQKIDTSV